MRSNMTATVEPGVLLMEFPKALEGTGLFYPPDPGEKTATMGGNAMTNAGGMRAVRYGVTRDYVLGMEVVLANGDILTSGREERENLQRIQPDRPDGGQRGNAGHPDQADGEADSGAQGQRERC